MHSRPHGEVVPPRAPKSRGVRAAPELPAPWSREALGRPHAADERTRSPPRGLGSAAPPLAGRLPVSPDEAVNLDMAPTAIESPPHAGPLVALVGVRPALAARNRPAAWHPCWNGSSYSPGLSPASRKRSASAEGRPFGVRLLSWKNDRSPRDEHLPSIGWMA